MLTQNPGIISTLLWCCLIGVAFTLLVSTLELLSQILTGLAYFCGRVLVRVLAPPYRYQRGETNGRSKANA